MIYHVQTVTSVPTSAPSEGPEDSLPRGIDKGVTGHDTCLPKQLCVPSLCRSPISIGEASTVTSSQFSTGMRV